MNVVDYVIIGILAVSIIYGVYHGFMQTLLSVASFFLSIFLAFQFGPVLSSYVRTSTGLAGTLQTYTDTVTRVGDAELARRSVTNLDGSAIERVIESVRLPETIKNILRSALQSQTFRAENLNTVNEYVQRTVVDTVVDIICYIVCFAVSAFLLSLLVSLLKHVCHFPLLRAMDGVAGGIFGLVRGAVIVYALFLLVPVVQTMLPEQDIQQWIGESRLAHLFSSDGFFVRVVRSL